MFLSAYRHFMAYNQVMTTWCSIVNSIKTTIVSVQELYTQSDQHRRISLRVSKALRAFSVFILIFHIQAFSRLELSQSLLHNIYNSRIIYSVQTYIQMVLRSDRRIVLSIICLLFCLFFYLIWFTNAALIFSRIRQTHHYHYYHHFNIPAQYARLSHKILFASTPYDIKLSHSRQGDCLIYRQRSSISASHKYWKIVLNLVRPIESFWVNSWRVYFPPTHLTSKWILPYIRSLSYRNALLTLSTNVLVARSEHSMSPVFFVDELCVEDLGRIR